MKEFDCFPEPDTTTITYDEKRENPIHIVAEYSEFPIKGGSTGPVTIRGKIGGVSGNAVLPTGEGFAVQWDMGFYTERGYGIPVSGIQNYSRLIAEAAGWRSYGAPAGPEGGAP